MILDPIVKAALCASAHRRMARAGVSVWPPITAPRINRRHIDGPYLSALDGTMHWLTLRERLLTKLGVWDAWIIERRHYPPTDLDVLFPMPRDNGSRPEGRDDFGSGCSPAEWPCEDTASPNPSPGDSHAS